MVKKGKSPYDEYTARCAMLGHLVPFTYCMSPGTDVPCRKILDCWHERIDIESYLKEVCTLEELESIRKPPRQKVMQLLELIEQARKRAGEA